MVAESLTEPRNRRENGNFTIPSLSPIVASQKNSNCGAKAIQDIEVAALKRKAPHTYSIILQLQAGVIFDIHHMMHNV